LNLSFVRSKAAVAKLQFTVSFVIGIDSGVFKELQCKRVLNESQCVTVLRELQHITFLQ
jgi:hypothetical protein